MLVTDTIRLLLFPALMAFAASSDLLTMTISNRLSLVLAAGFFLLTLIVGMSFPAVGMHLGLGCGADGCIRPVFAGWIGGGDYKLRQRLPCGSASITCSTIYSMLRCLAVR